MPRACLLLCTDASICTIGRVSAASPPLEPLAPTVVRVCEHARGFGPSDRSLEAVAEGLIEMPRCIKVALVTPLLHALHYQSPGIATARAVEAPAALDETAPVRVECEADFDAALGGFARVVNARLRAELRRGGLGLQIPQGLRRHGLRCPRTPFE